MSTGLDQPLRYIDSLTPARVDGERLEFLIVDRDDHPLGVTGLSDFSPRDRRATVGTWLRARALGHRRQP